MQTKIITYKRILNLGNYESKHLEETVEILEGEDVDYVTSQLMQRVERNILEDVFQKIEDEISTLRAELREIKNEYRTVESVLESVKYQKEPDTDDIPFDSGDKSENNLIRDHF
jgi:hypothetical protein